jgi:hypothetical protein
MGITPREFRVLNQKQKVDLLKIVFGHKNQLLQQAKINTYMDMHSQQVAEYMTKIDTKQSRQD